MFKKKVTTPNVSIKDSRGPLKTMGTNCVYWLIAYVIVELFSVQQG